MNRSRSGAKPAEEAKSGTLNPTLAATPEVTQMTEKAESHLQAGQSRNSVDHAGSSTGNDDDDAAAAAATGDGWNPTSEWVSIYFIVFSWLRFLVRLLLRFFNDE